MPQPRESTRRPRAARRGPGSRLPPAAAVPVRRASYSPCPRSRWQEYFAGEYADHSSEPPSAKTLSVFKVRVRARVRVRVRVRANPNPKPKPNPNPNPSQDPAEVKRTVCSISWYPDGGKKLAVAFAIMQFQVRARVS